MNLPNKLTLFRVLLVPVFVFLLLFRGGEEMGFRIAALAVFSLASFTDFLDGQIARRSRISGSSWTLWRISFWSPPLSSL